MPTILVVTFDTATGIRTGRLVGSVLLEDGAVLSGKIGSGQVASGHLTSAIAGLIGTVADAGITSAKIASGIIGWPHIGIGAILSGHLGSGQVASGHLTSAIAGLIGTVADNGITSAKLASGAVIGDRIANVGIFSGKIASGAIGPSTLLANAIIISGKIASGIIGWPHIGIGAILSGHLGSGQVASGHLTSAIAGLIGTVADAGITSAKIASGIIAGIHIKDGSILSGEIGSGIIAGIHIKDGSILSGEIGSGIIGDTLLKDFGLLSGKYASGSITEQALVSGISIDISEVSEEPGYRAAVALSAYNCVYIAAKSGNYVGLAQAQSGSMPAIGMVPANIGSGDLGVVNYGGRVTALSSVVSGQFGRQVFVGSGGMIGLTPPSLSGWCQQIMGAVKDNDEIHLFPEPGYIEIA